MRLPRRVPWAHLGELELVCSWIFTDEEDIEAKIQAVNKVRGSMVSSLIFSSSLLASFLPGKRSLHSPMLWNPL